MRHERGRAAAPGPLAALRRLTRSLTARCLAVAGLYAALVAVAVWVVAGASSAHLRDAFPSGDDLEEYRQQVMDGDYSVLASRRFSQIETLVLDGGGDVLYTSSSEFARLVGRDDLPFINEDSSESRFSVLEEERDDVPMYRVLRLDVNEDTGFEHVAGYALLDWDLNIVEGDLFPGLTSITPEQFGLLVGVIDLSGDGGVARGEGMFDAILREGQYVISRIEGESSDGEPRVIVYALPAVSAEDYSRAVSESNSIMLLLIPVVAVATVVLFLVEMRVISASTRPLSRAIAGYGGHRDVRIDPGRVVTELRPAYDGFMDLTGRLEGERADKQRMIADISHDIKTPLTVIRGYAQAIRDGVVPPGRLDELMGALCDKADTASSMVEALSEYAAAEHPGYRCERVPADLAQAVSGIVGGLEPLVEQRGCSIGLDCPRGPVPVRIDASLMARALSNLVSNACVHNERGTRVRVEVRCDRGEGTARVLVMDDGAGIDPELAGSLFDPFVTSNEARATGRGSGLGLAIARRFVELNGGRLSLAAEPPAPWSTCFELSLPLEEAPDA